MVLLSTKHHFRYSLLGFINDGIVGISPTSVAKLGKGANITTVVLLKICEALDCKLEDIMETIKD